MLERGAPLRQPPRFTHLWTNVLTTEQLVKAVKSLTRQADLDKWETTQKNESRQESPES